MQQPGFLIASFFSASAAMAACTLDFDEVGPRGGASSAGAGGAGAGGAGPSTGGGVEQGGQGGTAQGGTSEGGRDEGGQAGVGGAGGDPCGTCADIPTGFLGPVRLTDSAQICDARPVFAGGLDDVPVFDPPAAATCTCSCLVPADPGCPGATVNGWTNATCTGQENVQSGVPAGTCSDTFDVLSVKLIPNLGAPVASCLSSVGQVMFPGLDFTSPRVACPATAEACGSGVCFPDESVCIYSTTEESCPPGLVATQFVRYPEDVTDSRTCGCSSCGTLAGTCAPGLSAHSDNSCTFTVNLDDDLSCLSGSLGETIASVHYQPTVTDGVCTDPTVQVGGTVVVEKTTLLCCPAP